MSAKFGENRSYRLKALSVTTKTKTVKKSPLSLRCFPLAPATIALRAIVAGANGAHVRQLQKNKAKLWSKNGNNQSVSIGRCSFGLLTALVDSAGELTLLLAEGVCLGLTVSKLPN